MEFTTCSVCGARWLEGQHYWATGAKGNEVNLAGLVCNNYGTEQCINPSKGMVTPEQDTWEKRADMLGGMQREIDRMIGGLDKPPEGEVQ